MSKRGPSSTVRTFLAVELPASLRRELEGLRSVFGEHASLKWSAPNLLHITVRFLGSVPEARIPEVHRAAAAASRRVESFALTLSGLGAFPNPNAPRVLWVGLAHDAGYRNLCRLFSHIEDELAASGFAREERAFSPHITLARTRDTASATDRRTIGSALQRAKAAFDPHATWQVGELVVMRSELGREGPRYTPLAVSPLGSGSLESGRRGTLS